MSTTNLNLEEIMLDDGLRDALLVKINNNMQILDEKYGELKKGILEKTGLNTLSDAIKYYDEFAKALPIPISKVENMLPDGKYTDIATYYKTNTQAKITKYDGYIKYEMTDTGSSGYVYNIEAKDTEIELKEGHKYACFIKWRNISDFENLRASIWIKGTATSGSTSVSKIYSNNFSSHSDTENFNLDYFIISPKTNYYSIRFCINTPDIGIVGAGFDVEWVALLDITQIWGDISETQQKIVCENIENILTFPEVIK